MTHKIDNAELASRYQAGETCDELGRAFGCDPATIRNRLIKAGIALRKRWLRKRGPTGLQRLTVAENEELAQAYRDGATVAKLSEKHDVSTATVFKRLRVLGITLRPKGDNPAVDIDGTRVRCSCCRKFREHGEFYADPGHSTGLQSYCRECAADRKLFKDLKFPVGGYAVMLASQNGRCAGCDCLPSDARNHGNTRLAVDHCHDSMVVRTLLCSQCNLLFGLADDSSVILRRLADIAERYAPAKTAAIAARCRPS